ncbi:FCD domain-containing protein [Streptomyces sp. DW26H14]|uniref:FCD domain-containing protein n=1 Tax=Streptomyces sp. DW26H14 TaxID=3435395 RepID=UPI00403DE372
MSGEEPVDGGYGLKVQNAANQIRHKIAVGEFRPGMHLRQDQTALALGQSRVPVREAFKILVAEQLLIHHRNRGHFVTELTPHEMADICWLRESLEAELARTADRITAEDIERLGEINGEIESLIDTGTVWRRVELDERFHEILWSLANRPVLFHEVKRVAERQRPYRVLMSERIPARDRAAAAEHRELLDALRQGDFARYTALLVVHISRARELVGLLEQDLAARNEDLDEV